MIIIDEDMAKKLAEEARSARESAYAPYSGFKVGAAILFDDGRVICGCNVENASYGLSLCAERNAMTTAVTCGKRRPVAAAVIGEKGQSCPPCGACRQFLAEFNTEMDIILENEGSIVLYKLSELLPFGFSKKDMGVSL